MNQNEFNKNVITALATIPYLLSHNSSNDSGFSAFHKILKQLQESPMESRSFIRIDNEPYDWNSLFITGAQVRELASVPQTARVYLKVKFAPDKEIEYGESVKLGEPNNILQFSTQSGVSTASESDSACHAHADHQAGEQEKL